MLEMIFFISLGITFVLIVFLVYNFRQKFSTLEQKCDTMFEIINGIVKELNNRHTMEAPSIPENVIFRPNNVNEYTPVELPKLVVSDDDTMQEELEEESEEESEEEIEEESEEESEEDQSIKVISIDMNDIDEDELPVDTLLDSNNNTDDEKILESYINPDHNDHIYIEKVEELPNNESALKPSNIESMEVYRKMNLSALKALVIERGLITDTTKLKKYELLKLLESQLDM